MSEISNHSDMVQLARRALHHQQNGTTDLAESVMHMPTDAYTNVLRYRAERDRIFKTLPLALALTIEMPEPGDFKTMLVMETPILLVRGDDHIVRAFLNVCRHRGARVCNIDSGNTRSFNCPYHAWIYDRQGILTSRYAADSFGEVPQDELGLSPLGCEETVGLIWVTLGSSESFDIAAWLGAFAAELASLKLTDWYLYAKRELAGPGWKVTMDGYLEIYHHNVVHGATVGKHTIGNLLVLDTYGPHQRMTLGRKSLDTLVDQPEEEWQPLEHIRLVHSCFPNLSISGILGDHCLVSQIFPGPTPDTTTTIQMVMAAREPKTPEELAATRHFDDMVVQAVQDEDYRLGFAIQEGINSNANHQFLYGKNEPAVQNYHNWIARFMNQDSDIDWQES